VLYWIVRAFSAALLELDDRLRCGDLPQLKTEREVRRSNDFMSKE